MAHGKDAARDLRYGRRGGRWANGDGADTALAYIDTIRSRGLADGTWPDGTPRGDRECTVKGCGLPISEHQPPCRWCGRSPEHHAPGDEAAEIAGKARMAVARQRAGLMLTDIDQQALASLDQEGAA